MNSKEIISIGNFGGKGWLFIIMSLLVLLFPPMVQSVWQVAANIWENAYGWNQATILSMVSVGNIILVIMAFVLGKVTLRVSPKKLAVIWAVVWIVCVALLGFAHEFWVVCLLIILITPFGACLQQNILPVMIGNWFPRKKGAVMGIVTLSFPIANGTTVLLFTTMFAYVGMDFAFMPYVYIAVAAFLLLLIWAKDNPEEAGFSPDNDKSLSKEEIMKQFEEEKSFAAKSQWSTKRLLATKEVWFIAVGLGTITMIVAGCMLQMFPRLQELGYDDGQIAVMFGISAIFSAPCGYLIGVIDVKLGSKFAGQVTAICAFIGVLLNLSGFHVPVFISMVIMGFCVCGTTNVYISITMTYWGRAHFPRAYGVIQPIGQFISALAMVYMAQTAAYFGNYTFTYVSFIVFAATSFLLITLIKKDGSFIIKKEAQFAMEDVVRKL